MGNKFGARRVILDGITFDSRKEARRYQQLKLLERAGVIRALQVHPRFVILPKHKQPRDRA